MSIIGTFIATENGYAGTIKTLNLNVKARLVPTGGGSERAPDYRMLSENVEIGGGWKRTSETDRDYISVTLDDPSLPNPIYASLVLADDGTTFNLFWSRPKGK
jgi:uncharacterized protein (DUF736 family)